MFCVVWRSDGAGSGGGGGGKIVSGGGSHAPLKLEEQIKKKGKTVKGKYLREVEMSWREIRKG